MNLRVSMALLFCVCFRNWLIKVVSAFNLLLKVNGGSILVFLNYGLSVLKNWFNIGLLYVDIMRYSNTLSNLKVSRLYFFGYLKFFSFASIDASPMGLLNIILIHELLYIFNIECSIPWSNPLHSSILTYKISINLGLGVLVQCLLFQLNKRLVWFMDSLKREWFFASIEWVVYLEPVCSLESCIKDHVIFLCPLSVAKILYVRVVIGHILK